MMEQAKQQMQTMKGRYDKALAEHAKQSKEHEDCLKKNETEVERCRTAAAKSQEQAVEFEEKLRQATAGAPVCPRCLSQESERPQGA